MGHPDVQSKNAINAGLGHYRWDPALTGAWPHISIRVWLRQETRVKPTNDSIQRETAFSL